MRKQPHLLWIAAVFLGWLLDFLFWKQAPGVNFALYAGLCLVGGFLVMRLDQKRISRGALWLIPLILFFAVTTFIRSEPLTVFLGVVYTLFLMALLAITYLSGRWLAYGLADYFSGLLKLAGSMIARPLSFNAEVQRDRAESGNSIPRASLWPILRGILIALPVLAVFAALLGSADIVFGHQLDVLMGLLRLERLPEYIFRLVYILIAAYALAGVYLHAATRRADEQVSGEGKPPKSRFLGFVEAAIVLGSVVILFAAFVIVQFRYFFGGQLNISIEGYTYSEYARRGFGELMLVAFFSLLMILAFGAVTRRENELQRRLFSGLSALIVVLVTVMLVSAYQRLALYEIAYGFSRLRTYTHVLLIWMGLLLATVVVLEILHTERAFAAAALIASLGFAASLSALNVDTFIARQNVNRAARGEQLDVPYLVSLSTDSVPPLAEIFEDPSYPEATREAVGAVLACRVYLMPQRSNGDLRSFNLSRWQAENALAGLKDRLDTYRFVNDGWPPHVVTSDKSQVYDCRPGGYD